MKKLALFCLLSVYAFAGVVTTGYHRVNQILARATGSVTAQVVPYANIYVTSTATGLAATIYSDPTLLAPIATSTVSSDANGNYSYYVPINYCVTETVSSPGMGSVVTPNICGNTGTLATPISIPNGGTGASTASQALINLGGASLFTTSPQTFLSGINVVFENLVQKCEQFPGSSADAKLMACLAAVPSGGTADARGFGATTQTFVSTVSCGTSGLMQTILFDPTTILQPATSSLNMFNPNSGCQISGARVVLPGSMTYTGRVFVVNDNIRDGANFSINNVIIDARAETNNDNAAGYGFYLSASDVNTQSIAFASFSNLRCFGLLRCFYMTTSGTGFVNGNQLFNVEASASGAVLEMNSASTSGGSAISGNVVTALQGEATNGGAGPSIILSGSGQLWDNNFAGLKLWDVTTGITNTNTNALRNQFFGANDGSVIDANKEVSAFPNQNIYMTTSSFNDKGLWHSLGVGTLSVGGAPLAFTQQQSLTLAWNYSGGSAESDYFNNDYTGGANYAHHWYGANSANTNYIGLGGFNQAGGFVLDNGNFQGISYQITPSGGGLLGPVVATGQEIVDDATSGGWSIGFSTTSTNGVRIFNGVPTGAGTLLWQFDPSGNLKNGTTILLASNLTGDNGTGTKIQLSDGSNNLNALPIYNANGSLTNSNLIYTALPQKVNTCGTTTTCSNTGQTLPRVVWGTVTLSGGTATVTGMTAFTSSTSFNCTGTDTTTAAAVKIVNASSSSITITGTSTDAITYHCVGN